MAERSAPTTDRPGPVGPMMSSRATTKRVKHRRHVRTVKAVVGAGVLLVIASVAFMAGVRTVADVVSSSAATRLERYARGDRRVVYTSRAGRFRAEFPSEPIVGSEQVHLYTGRTWAHRLLSPVPPNAGTVELAWFDIGANGKVGDPAAFLAALAPVVAKGLESDAPIDPHVVSDSTIPAYDFTAPAPAGATHGDYHVRAMLSGRRIYMLRVQARGDDAHARAALAALAGSFRLL